VHPAYSIIVFTTASGAGYGLLFAMSLFAAFGALPDGFWFVLTGFAFAFAMIAAGLLSSTFHLGRPERAMRAFSQWRSSWLSREAIAALATFLVSGLFAANLLFSGDGARGVSIALACACAAACIVTVVCTAMIYASLKPIRRWRNGWVTPNYLALALMTGTLWLNALVQLFGGNQTALAWFAMATIAVAWVLKRGYWRFIDGDEGGPTAETATGLGDLGRVRLLDAPHTSDNYLMKEMGYRVARKHAEKLRRVAAWSGFALPLASTLAALALGPGWLAKLCVLVAAAATSVGVLVERWLFFAEAKHSVTLYYGARTA
jgi:DMSO reductase anchor subunit